MELNRIEGYTEVVENLMNEKKVKSHQKTKIDALMQNALREKSTDSLGLDIRMILEAGELIYED